MKRKNKLVSSKEVLDKAKISRATLNNYIRMGILPKPILRKPEDGEGSIRKMGYFPREVLGRVEKLKRLKSEGRRMEEIVVRLGKTVGKEQEGSSALSKSMSRGMNEKSDLSQGDICDNRMKLSLDHMTYASYVLNYDFEIVWINSEAEKRFFWNGVSRIEGNERRNIFRLLFNWEFHSRIQNWKDLLGFHMSFVKEKYAKTWIKRLYSEISKSEVRLLEDIYDKVPDRSGESIEESYVSMLMMDGTTNAYRVFTISFREGRLFSYVPII